jgi:hypothetical protein
MMRMAEASGVLEEVCKAAPPDLRLSHKAIMLLLHMLRDEAASTGEVVLATAACSNFINTPGCLGQVRAAGSVRHAPHRFQGRERQPWI